MTAYIHDWPEKPSEAPINEILMTFFGRTSALSGAEQYSWEEGEALGGWELVTARFCCPPPPPISACT